MNIKEIAKEMTKEEFINRGLADNNCPNHYGLNALDAKDCVPFQNCRKCYEFATKDVKFKGEESKQYRCIKDVILLKHSKVFTKGNNYKIKNEARNLKILLGDDSCGYFFNNDQLQEYFEEVKGEDELKEYFTDEAMKEIRINPNLIFERLSDGLKLIAEVDKNMETQFVWNSGHKYLSPNDKWHLVREPKPVPSFMDAVKSSKRVSVRHKLLKSEQYKDFCDLDSILASIGFDFNAEQCRDILSYGTWYVEG